MPGPQRAWGPGITFGCACGGHVRAWTRKKIILSLGSENGCFNTKLSVVVCFGKTVLESAKPEPRNFTIVTNPKPIPVNNDCARHKGLCGSGKGDLFHCKRPLFISKRKQASLIYMRKSEPTLSSPGITAHTSSERLTAFWRYAVLFSFLELLY